MVEVLPKGSHHIRGVFARSIGVEVRPHVLYLQLELFTRSVLGSLEMQMLKEMCYSTRGLSLVPTSAFDEHRQTK